jgi:hypothetical protein
VIDASLPTNPVHVLDLSFYLPGMFLIAIALWRKRTLGYAFVAPLLLFNVFTGAGILFANALMRTVGMAVSFVPDIIIGSIVMASIVLSFLYLKGIKKPIATERFGSQNRDDINQGHW